MEKDDAYKNAEMTIEHARTVRTTTLNLGHKKYNRWETPNDEQKLTELPESLCGLKQLKDLNASCNQLKKLPENIGQLTALQSLDLRDNKLTELPESIGQLTALQKLYLDGNELKELPETIGQLTALKILDLGNNHLTDLPPSLKELHLYYNSFNPELAAAYKEGTDAVMAYLRAKEGGELVLNEAKLILVGEGGVGKTSLLSALRGDPFIEDRPTTHGVEVDIKSLVMEMPRSDEEVSVSDVSDGKGFWGTLRQRIHLLAENEEQETDEEYQLTLNGWDFGGQNIYRHTHQLFFTAPAIYLAVWEPRRGPEQSRVAEWIKMIKHRAYDEARPDERPRILVVATHGGPTERLDHIDEQALRDEFGDLIVGFHHVDSKPDADGICYQLDELKAAITCEAAAIPSVGRTVPRSWKDTLEALRRQSEIKPYTSYEQFVTICNQQKVTNNLAVTYARILNELGYLVYYPYDQLLRNTIILNPEYLSKAIGFVLEDKATKEAHGLVEHTRLGEIWHNPAKPAEERYPKELHPIFIRLMEKFDLSYQVVMPHQDAPPTSLMAQLVPGLRPEGWQDDWQLKLGDTERTQVCRILDAETGRTAEAEGLMYRLIVRLHRYSLGRDNYHHSRHWKTGMILDDGYNGRGFIEEIGGDVYVTVRAAYPERFLHHLCSEIQWLVEHFWKGLDARMYVPCPLETCKGLLELDEMIDNKANEMPKIRCSVCREYHRIDDLMATMQPKPQYQDAVDKLSRGQQEILGAVQQGFGAVDSQLRVIMSQADEQYEALLNTLIDPAKDGPRLFSFEAVDRSCFNPKTWTREKFRLTLWCEHRRLPLTALNPPGDSSGVYEIELTRYWMQKAAPVIKVISTTLSLALRIAVPGTKLATDDAAYKAIGEQLEFGVKTSDALIKGGEEVGDWLVVDEKSDLDHCRQAIRAKGSVLRELHALLQKVDPVNGFGGLERVRNKRQEFLWVHKQYVSEY